MLTSSIPNTFTLNIITIISFLPHYFEVFSSPIYKATRLNIPYTIYFANSNLLFYISNPEVTINKEPSRQAVSKLKPILNWIMSIVNFKFG